MMLNILEYPNPLLLQKSVEVDVVDDTIRELLVEMEKVLFAKNGIGLAAPQVGVFRRVIVVRTNRKLYKLINPKIIERKGKYMCDESCLSVPKRRGKVLRDRHIKVVALDEFGKKSVVEFNCFEACCIQHEIDHLDGILFIDRIEALCKK